MNVSHDKNNKFPVKGRSILNMSPLTSHTLKLMNNCKDFQNLIETKVYINVP